MENTAPRLKPKGGVVSFRPLFHGSLCGGHSSAACTGLGRLLHAALNLLHQLFGLLQLLGNHVLSLHSLLGQLLGRLNLLEYLGCLLDGLGRLLYGLFSLLLQLRQLLRSLLAILTGGSRISRIGGGSS